MSHPHLMGASILIVEDEPLIALDITMAFDKTGAHLTTTNTLKHATTLVEHKGLTAVMIAAVTILMAAHACEVFVWATAYLILDVSPVRGNATAMKVYWAGPLPFPRVRYLRSLLG